MPHPPFIILDETSTAPLYRQIYDTIRHSILSGGFYSGKQLPASRHLAKQLGISRMTVINAYDQLLAEGYLESRPGAGTFVARQLPETFLKTPNPHAQTSRSRLAGRKIRLSDYGGNISKAQTDILLNNRATPAVAFQHGLAAVEEFPLGIWAKLANKCIFSLKRDDFGYGEPAGAPKLRSAIAEYLKSFRAVNCAPEQVIITNGAQHAFELIGRVLIARDTGVLIENPCYSGARLVFQALGARLVPGSVDEDGLNVASVSVRSETARLAYVTPSHQFPLGVTMSLSRRMQLLEWAKRADGFIIEDDYDSEFRYEGRPLASLQGLDRHGRVLYIGTFSKTIFPALRLGCLIVPADLIELFSAARALDGSHSPLIDQETLAAFIDEGHFTRHVRRMRKLYQRRQEILVTETKKHLAGRLDVKKSVAGMHLVGWLPEGVSDKIAAEKAAARGIKTAAISSFLLKPLSQPGGLVLGFTSTDERQIKQGVKRLAEALKELR